MRYSALTTGIVIVAACLLAGCSSRTDVSLTGNTPTQYSHVFITTQEVWFNTSATAGPDEGGWTKFPLSNPTTLDLAQDASGTLGKIATSLRQLPGTYSQIRLIPLDAGVPLATSAKALGAIYNAEADFTDSAGTNHQLPLELLNPDKGIGITGSLHIAVGSFGSSAALTGALGTTNTTSANTTGMNTTGTTTASTSTTSTTSSTTTSTTFAVSLDGGRDLVPFTFGTTAVAGTVTPAYGVLLSSHAGAFNLDSVGGISGTLTLTNLPGVPSIEATAETLSADGSRHVAVLSAPVRSDGTFVLYPLPSSTSTAATYDVVIHGTGIATIVIKTVTIPLATSTATSTTNTTTAANTTTNTTTNTSTVAPTTAAPTTNIVSIGTLVPRAATAYATGITTNATSPLTADAQVGFYQSLSGSGEVPYQIEASPIDPFNQVLANALQLSLGTIDSGTYVASGDTITLFSSAPLPASGSYYVAASAPSFADGPLTPRVSSATPTVTVTALAVVSGASLAVLQASILPVNPTAYTDGELLVSHNGTLVSRAALGSVLSTGGTVSAPVPAGTSSAKYFVSVRVWNSADLTKVTRQSIPTLVDMSGGGNGAISFSIN